MENMLKTSPSNLTPERYTEISRKLDEAGEGTAGGAIDERQRPGEDSLDLAAKGSERALHYLNSVGQVLDVRGGLDG